MGAPQELSLSSRLHARAKQVFPGGFTRATLVETTEPVFVSSGKGAYLHGVNGRRYLDCSHNFTSVIHGHAHPAITQAVTDQLQKGTAFSLCGESEIKLAEALQRRAKTFENVCFSNSGTEAVLFALKAARAATGRPLIAKCEGAYHGLSDFADISVNSSPSNWGDEEPASVPSSVGTPQSVLDGVVAIPYNDVNATLRILEKAKDRLACVLLDPMASRLGLIPATAEYLQAIRDFCTREGVVLIFDQVINFRLAYGGVEEFFGVEPDISTLAKVMGGGFPVGAVAGRKSVMEVFSSANGRPKVTAGGTFSANPVTMVAGLASLEALTRGEIDKINRHGERVRASMTKLIEQRGLNACITGAGSLFKFHFGVTHPRNHRDTYPSAAEAERGVRFRGAMMARDVHLIPSAFGAISTAMTDDDVSLLIKAASEAIEEVYAGA